MSYLQTYVRYIDIVEGPPVEQLHLCCHFVLGCCDTDEEGEKKRALNSEDPEFLGSNKRLY